MMFEPVLKQIGHDLGIELNDLCFLVVVGEFQFPFSFFAFEDENFLGLFVTDENGAEKLHVIVKSEIVFFRMHYLDELGNLYDSDEHNNCRGVMYYE